MTKEQINDLAEKIILGVLTREEAEQIIDDFYKTQGRFLKYLA